MMHTKKINNVFKQRIMLQVHLSAVQSLLFFLKLDSVGSCLILSSRLLAVCTSMVFLDCILISFHDIPMQVKGSSDS